MKDTTQEYGDLLNDPDESHGGLHELHITHLVMGIAFAGIAVVWLLSMLGAVPDADLGLLVPLPFLFAGGLGLLALVLSHRRRT